MKKINRQKKMTVMGEKKVETDITKFRKDWMKKNYDLADITQLCEFKLGISGWCNEWNEPDEQIYHIKIMYRDECIGTFEPSNKQDNMFERFEMFITHESFIIFMKVKIENEDK